MNETTFMSFSYLSTVHFLLMWLREVWLVATPFFFSLLRHHTTWHLKMSTATPHRFFYLLYFAPSTPSPQALFYREKRWHKKNATFSTTHLLKKTLSIPTTRPPHPTPIFCISSDDILCVTPPPPRQTTTPRFRCLLDSIL